MSEVPRLGFSAAAGMWARRDVRRRWAVLVALGLLAGVAAGVALAALAGARRSDTAFARFRQTTRAADAIVFPSQVGEVDPDFTALAARPEVDAIARWDLIFGNQNDQPGGLLFASDDGTLFGTIDRPLVVKGRMYDPDVPDEVVVDENAAHVAPVGTTFRFQPYAASEAETAGSGTPSGPTFTFHVVGEIREVDEYLFVQQGQAFLSPAFVEQNRTRIAALPNAEVVLRNGAAGIPALQRDVNGLFTPGTPVLDLHKVGRRVTTTIDVEYIALLLSGLAVIVAGGFLVAQPLIRSAGTIGEDAGSLAALGMRRREVAAGGLLPHLLSAGTACAASFATAVTLSPLFPVGLSRRLDPNPGLHADWLVLAPGAAIAALLLGFGAWLVARDSYRPRGSGVARQSGVVAAIRRRAPLTVGIGTGMAFETHGGLSAGPLRPALAGAMVGVFGVVATLSINAGIHHALTHPALAGVSWDAEVTPNASDFTARSVSETLAKAVEQAGGPGVQLAVRDRYLVAVDGVGVPAFSIRSPDGGPAPFALALTDGRAPRAGGEAAIGPATARELGVHVGQRVRVGDPAITVRVVGEALFPTDPHAEFDEGIWLPPATFDRLVPPLGETSTGGEVDRLIAVRAAPGQPPSALIDTLAARVGSQVGDVEPPPQPSELTNLSNVRSLPAALAGFLAAVAIGAVLLALLASTRQRRRDYAVLRALGLTPRGTRMVLHAQGTAVGTFGLVLGIPLGLVAGRLGWRLVAEHVPLQPVLPVVWAAALLLIPVTLVVMNALAVLPGRRVARHGFPAEELRAE